LHVQNFITPVGESSGVTQFSQNFLTSVQHLVREFAITLETKKRCQKLTNSLLGPVRWFWVRFQGNSMPLPLLAQPTAVERRVVALRGLVRVSSTPSVGIEKVLHHPVSVGVSLRPSLQNPF